MLTIAVAQGTPEPMRNQTLWVPTPSGEIEVIVTGEALEVLRAGGHLFQDGISLIRHYRSFIAEVALEKYHQERDRSRAVVVDATDVAD